MSPDDKLSLAETAGLLHVKGPNSVRILGDPAGNLTGAEFVDFMAYSSFFNSDLGGMRIQRLSNGDIDTIFLAAANGTSAAPKMRVRGNGSVTVAGTIESTLGGYKFPDGTIQTTAGPSGPSTVYVARLNGFTPRLDNPTVILSKDVPAGSYLTSVWVQGHNEDLGGQQILDCTLIYGGVNGRGGLLGLASCCDVGHDGVLVLQDTATFNTQTTITVSCTGFHIQGLNPILMAYKLDSIQ